jgi:hypothetical protein
VWLSSTVNLRGLVSARHARNLEGRHAALIGYLQFDFPLIQSAFPQLLAEFGPGFSAGVIADQGVQHPLLGGQFRLGGDLFAEFFPRHQDGGFQQIANDLLNIAADIADLGEFGCLHLEEGRLGEPCQSPRDFGFADRSDRSSGYFSGAPRPSVHPAIAGAASDYAKRWRRRAWRHPARR